MASKRALHGALERSLTALTLGSTQAQADRETALASLEAGDMSQVIHLRADGKAGVTPIWQDRQVALPYPFVGHIDPTRADSGLDTPHFATGIELLTDGHVILDAQVRDWVRNFSDWITAVKVRVAVWAPTAPKPVSFRAVVHLTFSGYAAPSDDESDM